MEKQLALMLPVEIKDRLPMLAKFVGAKSVTSMIETLLTDMLKEMDASMPPSLPTAVPAVKRDWTRPGTTIEEPRCPNCKGKASFEDGERGCIPCGIQF